MRFTTTIASASVAAVLGLAGVSVAGAAANPGPLRATTTVTPKAAAASEQAATAPAGAAQLTAKRPGAALRKKIRRGVGTLIASTIGITRPELRRQLKAGKTIATIATEHGVQPQAVVDALKAAATTKIDAAVAAGKLDAERAAKLKLKLDTAIPNLVDNWHPRRRS